MSTRSGWGPQSVYVRYVAVGIGASALVLVTIPVVGALGPLRIDWAVVWAAFAAAAAATVVAALLPWASLVPRRSGQLALYAWSLVDVAAAGAAIAASGGQRSWFWAVFVLTTVFFAAGYPFVGQVALLAATVVTYLAAALAAGPVSGSMTVWRVAVILAAFGLASFSSAELRRHSAEQDRARREADDLANRLEQRERWWRSLIEHTGDPIVVFDDARRVQFVSPAFERLLGHRPEEVMATDISWVVHPDDLEAVEAAGRVAAGGTVAEAVSRLRRRDGDWRHVEVSFAPLANATDGLVVANLHDVTNRVQAEAALSHQATHDALTGLANSRAFYDCLDASLAVAKRRGEPLALVSVDLDRFKQANDTFGHAVGDLLLVAVGRRLEATLREADVIARLGGDEFTAVLATGGDPVSAEAAAHRLWEVLRRPMTVLDRSIELEVSVGVACWPDHGGGAEQLMRCADHAMYRAKRAGGGVAVFEERRVADRIG